MMPSQLTRQLRRRMGMSRVWHTIHRASPRNKWSRAPRNSTTSTPSRPHLGARAQIQVARYSKVLSRAKTTSC